VWSIWLGYLLAYGISSLVARLLTGSGVLTGGPAGLARLVWPAGQSSSRIPSQPY
jgi:hypothetical protein